MRAHRVHVFVADPGVMILGLLALDSVHLGLVDEGRERLAAAHERARDLRAPCHRLAALWLDGLFEVRLGNPARVAEISEQLRALAEEHALPQAPRLHIFGFAAGRRHILAIRARGIA